MPREPRARTNFSIPSRLLDLEVLMAVAANSGSAAIFGSHKKIELEEQRSSEFIYFFTIRSAGV
jgi:hypothetical protein